jgi:hypothetical protein
MKVIVKGKEDLERRKMKKFSLFEVEMVLEFWRSLNCGGRDSFDHENINWEKIKRRLKISFSSFQHTSS